MSKATKRKHVFGEVLGEYVLPEDNQLIVKVIAPRGNNLHEVETPDGERYLASMPSKFRKNVWIKRGDFVIVDPITEGDKVKAEIFTILYPKQVKYIQKEGKWPEGFTEKCREQTEEQNILNGKSQVNGGSGGGGSEGEEEDSEDSDNDDDLFVNTNRPNVFYEESEDSSDDDDDDDDEEEEDDDYGYNDGKTSDDSDSSSSPSDEDDDSSDMDEGICEQRRGECLDDMTDLERQFTDLKEQLYMERLSQVEAKLIEVKAGQAEEYLKPLQELEENMHIRTQVAGIARQLRQANIKNKYDCEEKAAKENHESDKILLHDQIRSDIEEKLRRLEEDRHNIDLGSDFWNDSSVVKKSRKKSDSMTGEKKKKAVSVSGPYIVYMLRDIDILEDWTAIRKARGAAARRKTEHVYRTEKNPYNARYEDGKLFYEGIWYQKGHRIVIDNKYDSPLSASITAINTGEVWVKRNDGSKSKLYIAQLQKGKYTIRPTS
ncbi:breast cancer metastasis-suppressor 1-like protein [Glandiceps talaboti]